MNVNELIKMLSELDEEIRELPILVDGHENYEIHIFCGKNAKAEMVDLAGLN